MTAEEKRQQHQKELEEKLQREARERLSGQKGKTSEKKYVRGIYRQMIVGYVCVGVFFIYQK